MRKTEIGNGWYEVIDTRKGDDVKPFYVNKKLRKKQWEWPEDVQKPEDIAPPAAWDMDDVGGRGRSESHRRGLADLASQMSQVKVRPEDVEKRRRALREKAHKKERFANVDVHQMFASDVDGEWGYVFKDYAVLNFDTNRSSYWGFGKKKTDLLELLSHSSKILKDGLLKRSNEDKDTRKEASQMSKNILSYMRDRKSSKEEGAHVWKILRYALNKIDPLEGENITEKEKRLSESNVKKLQEKKYVSAAELLSSRSDTVNSGQGTEAYPILWDELYCQVVRQTTDNKSLNKMGYPESVVRGFELLTLFAGTFKCTTGLYPYVMAHLDLAKKKKIFVAGSGDELDEARRRIATLARRAQIRLQKTCKMEMRKKVPTELEFRAVLAAMPVMVRVYMMDGTYKTLPINTHTTAQGLSQMMSLTIGVKVNDVYAIYEYDNADNKHYLQPETRIMDVIAVWQEQVELLSEEQRKTFRTSRFMFEVHHFLDMELSDHIGWSLLFMEAVRNVVNQVYPLTRKMVLDLAALQLQEELGDFTGDQDERMLNGNLHRYLPARFLTEDERSSMIEPLVKRWKRLRGQGYDQFECQLTYVEILKQSIWYGTKLFKVKPMMGSDEYPPNGVWFAISRTRIIVIDCQSHDIVEHISMDQIIKHGCGSWSNHWGGTIVKLLAGNIVRQHAIRVVAVVPGEAQELINLIMRYKEENKKSLKKGDDEEEEKTSSL